MKWVLDGSAINHVARASANFNTTFAALTPLVVAGELTFCDQVVVELGRTAEGDAGSLWADTVKGQRVHETAPYATQRWVVQNVERIVDTDDRYDCAAQVLAQARSLIENGAEELAVVTEDTEDKPTRRALSDACDALGIPWLGVPGMMAACAIPWP